jgi:glycosyltransferase involved in cell wall biosynthesis
MHKFSYILITAAKNEAAYIEKTIQSVINQTIVPQKWVVVDDGSTDRTAEIVGQYLTKYNFIELTNNDSTEQRSFISKVKAITDNYERVKNIYHDYLGILDADVSFDANYYESIMRSFEQNPKLGIAGGIIFDRNKGKYIKQSISIDWSVSGAIQMFRRECYAQIGGYIQIQSGEDSVAEVMARMKGWEVRTFTEIHVFHHRPTGGEIDSSWVILYKQGINDYLLGYHFLFFLARCIIRITKRPYILGSLALFCGYCWSWMQRTNRQVSPEFIEYRKAEQMRRFFSSRKIKIISPH